MSYPQVQTTTLQKVFNWCSPKHLFIIILTAFALMGLSLLTQITGLANTGIVAATARDALLFLAAATATAAIPVFIIMAGQLVSTKFTIVLLTATCVLTPTALALKYTGMFDLMAALKDIIS